MNFSSTFYYASTALAFFLLLTIAYITTDTIPITKLIAPDIISACALIDILYDLAISNNKSLTTAYIPDTITPDTINDIPVGRSHLYTDQLSSPSSNIWKTIAPIKANLVDADVTAAYASTTVDTVLLGSVFNSFIVSFNPSLSAVMFSSLDICSISISSPVISSNSSLCSFKNAMAELIVSSLKPRTKYI